MSTAYIVSNNQLIAAVDTSLESGESVTYAFQKTAENINASREFNLVNSSNAKILRGEKWAKMFVAAGESQQWGKELNPGEFFVG